MAAKWGFLLADSKEKWTAELSADARVCWTAEHSDCLMAATTDLTLVVLLVRNLAVLWVKWRVGSKDTWWVVCLAWTKVVRKETHWVEVKAAWKALRTAERKESLTAESKD